jgi:hypothetical protein
LKPLLSVAGALSGSSSAGALLYPIFAFKACMWIILNVICLSYDKMTETLIGDGQVPDKLQQPPQLSSTNGFVF